MQGPAIIGDGGCAWGMRNIVNTSSHPLAQEATREEDNKVIQSKVAKGLIYYYISVYII